MTEAIATKVDGVVVAVEVDGGAGRITVDGAVVDLAPGARSVVGSGTVSHVGRQVEIDHGNGDVTSVDVYATFLNATPRAVAGARAGQP